MSRYPVMFPADGEATQWFAWRPVRLMDTKRIAWLRIVHCRPYRTAHWLDGPTITWWEYTR